MLLLLLALLSITSLTAASSKHSPPQPQPPQATRSAPLHTRNFKPQASTLGYLTNNLHHPAPTSFCKCTCFSNSTIIPLDPSKSSAGTGSSGTKNAYNRYERALNTGPDSELDLEVEAEQQHQVKPELKDPETIAERAQTYRALSCNDCNRKFCLDYELPICKDAKEEDVFTTCFRECPLVLEIILLEDVACCYSTGSMVRRVNYVIFQ